MKIIIVGAGKVGFYLAQTLLEHNHFPTIVDQNKNLCQKAANLLDIPVINGDGTTIETLEEAGAADCDALVSVTGLDQDNLFACQLAKREFLVKKTIARVNNPKNAEVMKTLGVDIPISSTDNIARLLEREIETSAMKQIMDLNRGKASISEILLPENFTKTDKTLQQLNLPETVVIASIFRNGDVIIPRGNTTLFPGDKIIIVAENSALHVINKIFKLNN
ncbi:MAG: TrkA family potassium uptake protein [Oscillospiraceae bacterium]